MNKNFQRCGTAVSLALLIGLSACGGSATSAETKAPTTAPAGTTGDNSKTSGSAATSGSDTSMTEAMSQGSVSGTLVGAGSSAQKTAMEAWQSGFQEANPDATVEYDPVGSGGGREQFLAGGTMFAGSDAALSAEEFAQSKERCDAQGAIDLPHYISPIAIAYNLPAIEGQTLNLTPDAIAGIFAGTITTWNDQAITASNPDLSLPDAPINPVHRSDDSGTTKNFTDYLSAAAPSVWTWGAIETWDTEGPGGGEGAAQTSGVVAAVQQGEGSIGYADASQIGNLPAVSVGVAGSFVAYSPEAAAKVVDSSKRVQGENEFDYTIEVNRTPDTPDTYPIALVSYHIVCMHYETAEEANLVKAFMNYVGSAEGQQAAAALAGSAPLSAAVQAEVAKSVAAITGG